VKTIIFISGWLIPHHIAKGKLLWNEPMWKDYHTIFLKAKTPYSDVMVASNLDRLESLLHRHPNAILAGHSLGGWWLSNLIIRPTVKINKLVLWTPLSNTQGYPFNASSNYCPTNHLPNSQNVGSHKVLVFSAVNDLIVSSRHSISLAHHFKAMTYQLDGGHFYQKNHQQALNYMADWMEL
jgi:predicted alpha/beta hydrolase family esterase